MVVRHVSCLTSHQELGRTARIPSAGMCLSRIASAVRPSVAAMLNCGDGPPFTHARNGVQPNVHRKFGCVSVPHCLCGPAIRRRNVKLRRRTADPALAGRRPKRSPRDFALSNRRIRSYATLHK